MPPLGVLTVDFILGLFIGVYALASFAPPQLAQRTYRVSWLFGAAFLVAAYLQSRLAQSELSLSALSRSKRYTSLPLDQVKVLIAVVILGIILSFVGGMTFLRKKARSSES